MFRGFSTVKSMLYPQIAKPLLNQFSTYKTSFLTRKFSNKQDFEDTAVWAAMSEVERMNCALAESDPQTAKMAYYKGIAFTKMGPGYYNDSITAFEKAAELDEAYKAPAEKQIAFIYANLGQTKSAFEYMAKAYNDLAVTKSDPKKIDILRDSIGLDPAISAFKP